MTASKFLIEITFEGMIYVVSPNRPFNVDGFASTEGGAILVKSSSANSFHDHRPLMIVPREDVDYDPAQDIPHGSISLPNGGKALLIDLADSKVPHRMRLMTSGQTLQKPSLSECVNVADAGIAGIKSLAQRKGGLASGEIILPAGTFSADLSSRPHAPGNPAQLRMFRLFTATSTPAGPPARPMPERIVYRRFISGSSVDFEDPDTNTRLLTLKPGSNSPVRITVTNYPREVDPNPPGAVVKHFTSYYKLAQPTVPIANRLELRENNDQDAGLGGFCPPGI